MVFIVMVGETHSWTYIDILAKVISMFPKDKENKLKKKKKMLIIVCTTIGVPIVILKQ